MKKIIFAMAASLLFSASSMAADIPDGGYFLSKDGVPLTEEQMSPPQIRSNPMRPMSRDVMAAMAELPHSINTVVKLAVTEDGYPAELTVEQSSTSVVLDQYAVNSVSDWTFKPSKLGEKSVKAYVTVPVHFVSMKVATPATAVSKDMAKASPKEQAVLDRLYPLLRVTVYVTSAGKSDGKPVIEAASMMEKEDLDILSSYVERSIPNWTFTPAQNPDGEAISQEIIVSLSL